MMVTMNLFSATSSQIQSRLVCSLVSHSLASVTAICVSVIFFIVTTSMGFGVEFLESFSGVSQIVILLIAPHCKSIVIGG